MMKMIILPVFESDDELHSHHDGDYYQYYDDYRDDDDEDDDDDDKNDGSDDWMIMAIKKSFKNHSQYADPL